MTSNERPSRRAALLGDRPGSYAIARHVRMTPQKVRRVVNVVRGMDVNQALTVLKFAPQAASDPIYKVVASAAANAENVDNLRRDELFISQIFVDEGVTMRRIRPRAKGSAGRILKRASHITVVVEPRGAAEAPRATKAGDEAKAAKKGAGQADAQATKKAAARPAKKSGTAAPTTEKEN